MKTYNLGKLGTRLPKISGSIHYRCTHWSSDDDYYQLWNTRSESHFMSVGLCEHNGEIHVAAVKKDSNSDSVFIFKLSQVVKLIEDQQLKDKLL